MAITNYAELKTAIANWLERDDLTSRIPEFVALTEDRINLNLRVRAMEASTDLTISSQETALPTGFVGQRRLYLSGNLPRLEYYPPEDFWIRNAQSETGTPKLYTTEGDSLVVGPAPASTFTGKLLYWKGFTALSGDLDANWVLANARGLYLFGGLLEAAMYVEDDANMVKWATRWDNLKEEVERSNRKDRFPAGSLQVRSDVARGEIL